MGMIWLPILQQGLTQQMHRGKVDRSKWRILIGHYLRGGLFTSAFLTGRKPPRACTLQKTSGLNGPFSPIIQFREAREALTAGWRPGCPRALIFQRQRDPRFVPAWGSEDSPPANKRLMQLSLKGY